MGAGTADLIDSVRRVVTRKSRKGATADEALYELVGRRTCIYAPRIKWNCHKRGFAQQQPTLFRAPFHLNIASEGGI
jgi:hypothetical protein